MNDLPQVCNMKHIYVTVSTQYIKRLFMFVDVCRTDLAESELE